MNSTTFPSCPNNSFEYADSCFRLPCLAKGFIPSNEGFYYDAIYRYTRNYGHSKKHRYIEHVDYIFRGTVQESPNESKCPVCGSIMHVHGSYTTRIKHIPFGDKGISLDVEHLRYRCPICSKTKHQVIPFKVPGMKLTYAMRDFILNKLRQGATVKSVSMETGVGQKLIKDIDKQRLLDEYTEEIDGNIQWCKPSRQARYLGIDEFKLRYPYQMATVIIDLETGAVLWLQESKKKQVVYDFIDHVGDEWMKHVKAIACDMNADFASAFTSRFPHLDIVYDRFHIIKNFNDKVINKVRLDEQRRLRKEGNKEGADSLMRTRLILTANKKTLERRDNESREYNARLQEIKNANTKAEFTAVTPERVQKTDRLERYNNIINENELLLATDIVKKKLTDAYERMLTPDSMHRVMSEVVDFCKGTTNTHFCWFAKLIENHMGGIITFAKHIITSGKCEGTVQLIKTIRRASYGIPDTKYFFLKIMDASRRFGRNYTKALRLE